MYGKYCDRAESASVGKGLYLLFLHEQMSALGARYRTPGRASGQANQRGLRQGWLAEQLKASEVLELRDVRAALPEVHTFARRITSSQNSVRTLSHGFSYSLSLCTHFEYTLIRAPAIEYVFSLIKFQSQVL